MANLPFIFSVCTIYFISGLPKTIADEQCQLPIGGTGLCRDLPKCPFWNQLIKKPKEEKTKEDFKLLNDSNKAFCGNNGFIVCCPTFCQTPEGREGACIHRVHCPLIEERINTISAHNDIQELREFFQKVKCGDKSVCCPVNITSISLSSNECASNFSVNPPDPRTGCCGRDNLFDNKITGGTDTKIEEQPWLALLEYEKPDSIELSCGGFLISSRYVVTAAHCVVINLQRNLTTLPNKVRLGEYNIDTPGLDCTGVRAEEQCTEGHISIEIEEIIPYPTYQRSEHFHDIALIRLVHNARYTSFIRPICLPTVDITIDPPRNLTLWAAGWGATSDNQLFSSIKQQVDLPYLTSQQCEAANTTVSRNQLCAGGVKSKDSCKGDSGGPLMYENHATSWFYEAIGVVSFGPIPCGQANKPATYTKLFPYLPWIRQTITNSNIDVSFN